jgi:hypothetical protein
MVEGVAGAVAVGITTVLGVASDRTSKKRAQAFTRQYGSYEGFRQQVDEAHVQEVRRTRGDVAAGEALRGAAAGCLTPLARPGRAARPRRTTAGGLPGLSHALFRSPPQRKAELNFPLEFGEPLAIRRWISMTGTG